MGDFWGIFRELDRFMKKLYRFGKKLSYGTKTTKGKYGV